MGLLGPLLFQFGYFNERAFVGVNDFLARLKPFLKKLPKDHKFVVEIRNKAWLVPQFIEALRERGVALALRLHLRSLAWRSQGYRAADENLGQNHCRQKAGIVGVDRSFGKGL